MSSWCFSWARYRHAMEGEFCLCPTLRDFCLGEEIGVCSSPEGNCTLII
jgi:hypothetical protein